MLILVIVSALGTISALALLVNNGWVVALAFYVITLLLLLGILVSWLQDRYAEDEGAPAPNGQGSDSGTAFPEAPAIQPEHAHAATLRQPPAA